MSQFPHPIRARDPGAVVLHLLYQWAWTLI
jgi:hypothetical protein